MSVYTYTTARQNLAQLLDEAEAYAEVYIKRKNGQLFKVIPIKDERSGLDVPGIDSEISTEEMVDLIRTMRERL